MARAAIVLKINFQGLYLAKASWNKSISPHTLEKWLKFQSGNPHLKGIQIMRCMHVVNATKIEIHGSCDASAKAYAVVAYLHFTSDSSYVSLIVSKTRVSPVKYLSLTQI